MEGSPTHLPSNKSSKQKYCTLFQFLTRLKYTSLKFIRVYEHELLKTMIFLTYRLQGRLKGSLATRNVPGKGNSIHVGLIRGHSLTFASKVTPALGDFHLNLDTTIKLSASLLLQSSPNRS